ncbi:unnamed protein product [Toxocara canis]|uniref:Protein E(Sev)2B n=1 Tax=Toxocara canis TaxID=6265 RepID=A0A183TZT7_TOXCA|nr:unnamed protein product [Toxocara canis]
MEAVVTSDFFPTGTEEVDARQGEKLNVLTFMDNGEWVKVETARRVGFIPMNHIRIKPIWWYFGKLKRIDAEWILSECARNEGAFLIRSSESHPGEFSLSMKHNNAIEHYQIRKDHLGKYSIWQLKFASLNLLVDHYQRASISLDEYAYLAPIEPHERHKTIVIAVALYDFETQEEAELCFRRGQTLIITDRSDENWWQARTAHSKGFIPACYVRIIRTLNECPQVSLFKICC